MFSLSIYLSSSLSLSHAHAHTHLNTHMYVHTCIPACALYTGAHYTHIFTHKNKPKNFGFFPVFMFYIGVHIHENMVLFYSDLESVMDRKKDVSEI